MRDYEAGQKAAAELMTAVKDVIFIVEDQAKEIERLKNNRWVIQHKKVAAWIHGPFPTEAACHDWFRETCHHSGDYRVLELRTK